MRFSETASSWGPPTRGRRPRARFARILLKASMPTRCTARIRPRRPPLKSPTFSPNRTSVRAERVAIMTVNLLGLDQEGLKAFCAGLGEKPYRARQLLRWIHQAGVDRFDLMTDMSKGLRARLEV